MIDVDGLTFHYPDGTAVFEGFSWQVAPGEAWAVLGPSGCGKTTLLYLVAGLRLPTQGTVRVGGKAILRPRPQTGLILQDFGLLPWATVRDNVALGLRIRGFYGPDGKHAPVGEAVTARREITQAWLDRLGLSHVADSFPGQVSGGQRQRTAIARTLSLRPDLLLMDEPFASLDAPTREDLQNLMLRLRAETGLTTVVVTHMIEEAALLGAHVLLLGRLPNRDVRVIPNPGGADPAFRGSPRYARVCALLRRELEAVR
jgi:ABC-type nitrate/sulfonate/bicarbonate transport system ATPase subunit